MERKIFIIDDTKVYNRFMKTHLGQTGNFRVETFEDGDTAIQQLMTQEPYVVILDHNLSLDPAKNGIYYLREIKRLKPDLPVLYVTGDNAPSIKDEAMKAGAVKTILKSPVFLEELRTSIDELENSSSKKGLLSKFFGKN